MIESRKVDWPEEAVPQAPADTEDPGDKPYSFAASGRFNQRLGEALAALAAEVGEAFGDNLGELLLGGSFGRGEGGVLEGDGGEEPDGSLEVYLVVVRRRGADHDILQVIAKQMGAAHGLHFDCAKPLSRDDLPGLPDDRRWRELKGGHISLAGDKGLFAQLAPDALDGPPSAEQALRLLLDRGAGLLAAWREARSLDGESDPDAVIAGMMACTRALGEALLISHGLYQVPRRGRESALARLALARPDLACLGLVDRFITALQHSFRPDRTALPEPDERALADLARLWGAVLLMVERRRTGLGFPDLGAYTAWEELREPDLSLPQRWPGNLARHLKSGGLGFRHPRETLYRRLPILLGLAGEPVRDWDGESEAFLNLWRRYQ